MFDTELERFKTSIDLRTYAASLGYWRDARESWQARRYASPERRQDPRQVRHQEGAESLGLLLVSRSDDDHGSIIDFVQHRLKLRLGAVRKELRPWLGEPPVPVPVFPPPVRTNNDHTSVEIEYAKMQDAPRHSYLENERALPASLLGLERFAGRVRMDARGNAVFPHFDQEGLCGYEIKNKGFTGFASGGTKGLWLSHGLPEDQRLVFCESAIDALSHAVLYPDERARYASIGGKPSPLQPELIREGNRPYALRF